MSGDVPMRVWDAPTRLFHWAIVVLLCTAWLTEAFGWMELHFLCGYSILALLLFRLAWGFAGSDTARFSRFLKSPLAALQHLAHLHHRRARHRDRPQRRRRLDGAGDAGAAGCAGGTGLSPTTMPTPRGRCSTTSARNAATGCRTSTAVNFTLHRDRVVAHIVAIITYAVMKRHDLVRPMITGRKLLPEWMPPPAWSARCARWCCS